MYATVNSKSCNNPHKNTTNLNVIIDNLTPRCFKGPHLPISMFNNKQPNDHMSTAVVYSTSYGPAITRCIDT